MSYLLKKSDDNVGRPRAGSIPTAAEKYAEVGGTPSYYKILRSGSSTSGDVTDLDDIGEHTIKLNLQEATEILGSSTSIAYHDGHCNRQIDELTSCILSACNKCIRSPNGIFKGMRKSFPSKRHLINYFRKTINNKVDKNKNAIVVDGSPDLNTTYRQLDEISNSIAYHLREAKLPRLKRKSAAPPEHLIIGICLPMCYEYIVLLLAVLKLGAAILPIRQDLPSERIAEIIRLTQPLFVLISEDNAFLFGHVLSEVHVMQIGDLWDDTFSSSSYHKSMVPFKNVLESPIPLWKRPVAISVVPSDTQDLQALAYDSGAFLNRLKWEDHVFVYIRSEHVLAPPAFDTIDNLADVLVQLCLGVTLVIVRTPYDFYIPDSLFLYCEKYKLRRLTLWPALLKACTFTLRLFEEFIPMVSTIRYWFCIGGTIRSDLADMFFELTKNPMAQLINMYHHEHCVGALAFQIYESFSNSTNRSFFARLPIGTPVQNNDFYILDPDLNPVKDGEIGEIYISGMQLPMVLDTPEKMSNVNYMSNPFTKKKDRQLLIRTNDFGRIMHRSDGTRILIHEMTRDKHYFIDNQIVWLLHLDMYLERMPTLVKKAHTMCYRPHEDDQVILAFCVPEGKVSGEQIEEELTYCLPAASVPEVIELKEIPMLDDKPNENELLRMYQEMRVKRQKFDNWNSLGISDSYVLRAAKILTYCIYSSLGIPISAIAGKHWSQPFLSMKHASVTRGVFIVRELHRNRYPLYADEFIYSEQLKDLPELMIDARRTRGFCSKNCPIDEVLFIKNRYKLEIMVNNNRYGVCSLLGKCFTYRDQLDYYAEVSYKSMRKYFDTLWPMFVQKNLSLVIRKKKEGKKFVGAVLNMYWHDEIELISGPVPKDIAYKLELIHYLETGLDDGHFPQDKTHVMQVCYVGLDPTILTGFEIHGLTDKIIRSVLIVGKVRKFEALVIITYDYFTKDICVNSYSFTIAKECQVNQFIAADGTRPYALCPDSTFATLCWKPLSKVANAESHKRNPDHGPTLLSVIKAAGHAKSNTNAKRTSGVGFSPPGATTLTQAAQPTPPPPPSIIKKEEKMK